MALPDAVQGGKRPSPLITWSDNDGAAVDLTGATITARIQDANTGTARDADGVFTITNAAGGVFRWDLGTTDVGTAGTYKVQFVAVFGSAPTPAKTFLARWRVLAAI
jgi:hypothetical protein